MTAFAPVPWAFWVAVGLMAGSLGVDALLGRRFAGGEQVQDGATCTWLVISLSCNMLGAIALTVLHLGWIGWHVETLAAVGVALAGVGLGLRYYAIWELGQFFTWRVAICEGHAIVTRGLFRWLRHPSYLGGMVTGMGLMLALGNAWGLVVFCLTHVPLMLYRIRVEERVLMGYFGADYEAYQARSWRLVPWLF